MWWSEDAGRETRDMWTAVLDCGLGLHRRAMAKATVLGLKRGDECPQGTHTSPASNLFRRREFLCRMGRRHLLPLPILRRIAD
jgi:hypothetical protein